MSETATTLFMDREQLKDILREIVEDIMRNDGSIHYEMEQRAEQQIKMQLDMIGSDLRNRVENVIRDYLNDDFDGAHFKPRKHYSTNFQTQDVNDGEIVFDEHRKRMFTKIDGIVYEILVRKPETGGTNEV